MHIILYETRKSAVAERSTEAEYRINFKDIIVLVRMAGYVGRSVKKTIDSLLHAYDFNTETGFPLSRSWYLATNTVQRDN
jgi:hypothetical protein